MGGHADCRQMSPNSQVRLIMKVISCSSMKKKNYLCQNKDILSALKKHQRSLRKLQTDVKAAKTTSKANTTIKCLGEQ